MVRRSEGLRYDPGQKHTVYWIFFITLTPTYTHYTVRHGGVKKEALWIVREISRFFIPAYVLKGKFFIRNENNLYCMIYVFIKISQQKERRCNTFRTNNYCTFFLVSFYWKTFLYFMPEHKCICGSVKKKSFHPIDNQLVLSHSDWNCDNIRARLWGGWISWKFKLKI